MALNNLFHNLIQKDESLLVLLIPLFVFISMFFFHEGGHYIAAKLIGLNNIHIGYMPIFRFPNYVGWDAVNILDLKHPIAYTLLIALSGPVIGMIPFIIGWIVTDNKIIHIELFLLALYYAIRACGYDFVVAMTVLSAIQIKF